MVHFAVNFAANEILQTVGTVTHYLDISVGFEFLFKKNIVISGVY